MSPYKWVTSHVRHVTTWMSRVTHESFHYMNEWRQHVTYASCHHMNESRHIWVMSLFEPSQYQIGCIYEYRYMYVHIHVYVYIYIYICRYRYIYVCIQICTYVIKYTYKNIYIYDITMVCVCLVCISLCSHMCDIILPCTIPPSSSSFLSPISSSLIFSCTPPPSSVSKFDGRGHVPSFQAGVDLMKTLVDIMKRTHFSSSQLTTQFTIS